MGTTGAAGRERARRAPINVASVLGQPRRRQASVVGIEGEVQNQIQARRGPLSAEDEQSRDSLAFYGLAMFRAQCVETQLAILLATTLNPAFLRTPPDDRDRYFEAESAKTLGHLLTSLRDSVPIPESLEGRLVRALRLRNWLAHRYFRDREVEALSWDGREKMIAELADAAEFLREVDLELTAVSEAWLAHKGISREVIEAEMTVVPLQRARPTSSPRADPGRID